MRARGELFAVSRLTTHLLIEAQKPETFQRWSTSALDQALDRKWVKREMTNCDGHGASKYRSSPGGCLEKKIWGRVG